MKNKIFTLILLFAAMFTQAQITATVTDLTSSPIQNHTVYIMGDSANPGGGYFGTAQTSGNGVASFNGLPSGSYLVYTYDCNQSMQSQYFTSNTGSATFQICTNSNPPPCNAAFTAYPDSTNPYVIHFFNQSTPSGVGGTWTFGDGTSSAVQHPTHTYNAPGTYTVTLIVGTALCTDSVVQQITVGTPPNCQAAFSFMPDSANPNTIHFIDLSTGNPTSYSWNFGDGNTSTVKNPTHSYTTSGTFTVTLNISGSNCQSTSTQNVVISGSSTSYTLSGSVKDSLNQPKAFCGLILFDLQGIPMKSAMTSGNGTYTIYGVNTGSYKLQAFPDSNILPNQSYAPTYYGNTTIWANATTVQVNSNMSQLDIQLLPFGSVSGNGTISGNVGNGVKSGLPNVLVNLLDNNLNPLKSTITDVNGDYSFANLAMGDYKIWVEIPGKTTTPISVTLTTSNSNSQTNDFVVSGNTVVPKTTGIDAAITDMKVSLYPNPAENQLFVRVKQSSTSAIQINVFDLSGKLVLSKLHNSSSNNEVIPLNISTLESGSYIIRIHNQSGLPTQLLFNSL
jgi:PKD repeat protein